jgi:diguanylate cyclase (GGDEF)-like protein
MELQAVTASAATGIARITIALFMLGMYLAARRDRCTGYWAAGSLLLAVGSMAPLYAAPGDSLGFWFAGTVTVIGGVFWWWGLRLFFGRTAIRIGWWIIAVCVVAMAAVFAIGMGKPPRLLVFATGVTLGLVLVIREAWIGDGTPLTVSRAIVALSYTGVLLALLARSVYFLSVDAPVSPVSNHVVNVALLYMVPMACVILAATGTLLMYLERTVAEKDRLASRDDLTQLCNRRAVAGAGRKALTVSDHGISVLLIDVDHFKAVNDTLGHEAGDRVLCLVADALAGACRHTDVIGRHGGEEFCVLCPDTSLAEAQALGDRLIAAVAAVVRPDGIARPLSISIGIAVSTAGSSWDAMLHSADQALYAAKAAGRGQAISA